MICFNLILVYCCNACILDCVNSTKRGKQVSIINYNLVLQQLEADAKILMDQIDPNALTCDDLLFRWILAEKAVDAIKALIKANRG